MGGEVWGGYHYPLPIETGIWGENFFKLLGLCIFWCILGAILSATLLNSTGKRRKSGVWGHGLLAPSKSAYALNSSQDVLNVLECFHEVWHVMTLDAYPCSLYKSTNMTAMA